MIYGINDRLKFILQEEKWLLKIEEGDEDAQNKKEGP